MLPHSTSFWTWFHWLQFQNPQVVLLKCKRKFPKKAGLQGKAHIFCIVVVSSNNIDINQMNCDIVLMLKTALKLDVCPYCVTIVQRLSAAQLPKSQNSTIMQIKGVNVRIHDHQTIACLQFLSWKTQRQKT